MDNFLSWNLNKRFNCVQYSHILKNENQNSFLFLIFLEWSIANSFPAFWNEQEQKLKGQLNEWIRHNPYSDTQKPKMILKVEIKKKIIHLELSTELSCIKLKANFSNNWIISLLSISNSLKLVYLTRRYKIYF